MSARLTDQQRLYRTVSERAWQQTVRDLLAAHSYTQYHTHDSRRSDPGFPDLIAANADGDILALELKTETGKVSAAQQEWLDLLNRGGVEARALRPSEIDWLIARLQRRHGAVPEPS